MKKLYKYALWLAAAVAIAPMTACSDNDEVDPYTLNYAYMYQPESTYAQLEYKANGEFLIDVEDPLYLMPVRLTKPAPADLDLKVEIDASLVDEYNKAHGTDYHFLEGCSVLTPVMHIEAGKYTSLDSVVVSFGDHSAFQCGYPDLMLPVAITYVNHSGITLAKSGRIFLTFSSTYNANNISMKYVTPVYIDERVDGWESAYTNVDITNYFNCEWYADDDITITATIDNSLITAYNNVNDMNYLPLPGTTITTSTVNIAKGENSASFSLVLGDYTNVVTAGEMYLIPVKFEITSGEGAELDTETAYFAVEPLPPFLTAIAQTNAPAGYTMITKGADWTCSYASPAGAVSTFTNLFNSGTSYNNYAMNEGGVVNIDLGSEITCDMFMVRFGSYYYSASEFQNVEVSTDGTKWTEWGNLTMGQQQTWWVTPSKPMTFRYMRFVCGKQAYNPNSTYYNPRLRQMHFYKAN